MIMMGFGACVAAEAGLGRRSHRMPIVIMAKWRS
jgi:hypothetical protein